MLKKSLVILFALLISFTLCLSNNVFASSADDNINVLYTIKLFCDNDVDMSQVKFNVYQGCEKEIESSDVKQFDEFLVSSYYFDSSGQCKIIPPSEYFTISIDLSSLPDGYGVDYFRKFCSIDTEICYFNVELINSVDYEYKNFTDIVTFTSEYDTKLYIDYTISKEFNDFSLEEIESLSTLSANININAGQCSYNVYYSYYFDKDDLYEKYTLLYKLGLIDESVFNSYVKEYINSFAFNEEPFTSQKDENLYLDYNQNVTNNGYKVLYKIDTDDATDDISNKEFLAQYISEKMVEIRNYYVNILGYDFPENSKDANYYNVYLDLVNETESSTGFYVAGSTYLITYGTEGNIYRRGSYITLEIEKKLSYSLSELEYILLVCAHELFHSICISMNSMVNTWISEASATFMALYYVDVVKEIENIYIKNKYEDFINYYSNSSYSEFCYDSYDFKIPYGGCLLFIYFLEECEDINFVKLLCNYTVSGNYDFYNMFLNLCTAYELSSTDLFTNYQLFKYKPYLYCNIINNYYSSVWQKNSEESLEQNLMCTAQSLSSKFYKIYNANLHNLDTIIYFTISFNNINDSTKFYIMRTLENGAVINENITFASNQVTFSIDAINAKEFIYTVAVINSHNTSSFSFSYSCSAVENNFTNINSIVLSSEQQNNISLNNTSEIMKITNNNIGFYKFTLLREDNYYPENSIEIYDSNFNYIRKSTALSNELAVTKANENSLVAYIGSTFNNNQTNPYYIRIKNSCGTRLGGNLIVSPIEDDFKNINLDLSINKQITNISGDMAIRLDYNVATRIDFNFTYQDINNDSNVTIYLLEISTNYQILSSYSPIDNSDSEYHISTLCNNLQEELLILVTGLTSSGILTVNSNLDLSKNFDIVLDKNNVDNSLIGSEVNINNGLREQNSITVGFTRCAFINDPDISNSRLDYVWFSSNQEVASVSNYGTIIALSPGVTIITARHNSLSLYSYVVINVQEDLSVISKSFTITLDLRSDGTVGTEVSSGNGVVNQTSIKIGYTRLVSLTSDAPVKIIQAYSWYSEDSSVASISSFGTITALNVGTTIIYGIYRYNSRFTGNIVINVYN